MSIYVLGDIHAEFNKLNVFISRKKPSMILQCGDFGYWPKYDGRYELGNHRYNSADAIVKRRKWFQCGIKNEATSIYFCDGNHEDHSGLKALEVSEVCPNVLYMKRGSHLTLPDGRNVLFVGGGQSLDRHSRIPGETWFPNEVLSEGDLSELPEIGIDIVISHTCPREFACEVRAEDPRKFQDPSHDVLSIILRKYAPRHWYFGHFHIYQKGVFDGVQWTALNRVSDTGWFERLPPVDA